MGKQENSKDENASRKWEVGKQIDKCELRC